MTGVLDGAGQALAALALLLSVALLLRRRGVAALCAAQGTAAALAALCWGAPLLAGAALVLQGLVLPAAVRALPIAPGGAGLAAAGLALAALPLLLMPAQPTAALSLAVAVALPALAAMRRHPIVGLLSLGNGLVLAAGYAGGSYLPVAWAVLLAAAILRLEASAAHPP